ncbi:glycosyltransferase family 9 protein [Candidatus Woesearchaeota archaeon]|nr:glycosyltransferase family 9 protein [Candidatus Woesearchaeota archaeon]
MKFNRDCKSFPGIYACEIMKAESYEDCSNCIFYEPIEKKILIIQLGAMGDVVRSTSILPAIKEKYGRNIKITWLTSEECKFFLENSQHIDEILIYNPEIYLRLQQESFDILLNLEIAPPATLLANIINAKEKFGYYFDKDGHPSAFNKGAEIYLHAAFSDVVNRKTRISYQEMIFSALNLNYKKQNYSFKPKINEKYLQNFLEKNNLTKEDKVIGINIGSASRFPSKTWHLDNVKEFVEKIKEDYKIILLGGPNELKIKNGLKEISAITNDFNNNLEEFCSILSLCKILITGDSLHLHLAISMKIPTIALFFTTPSWQIENYNFLKKISSPMLENYYMSDQYNEELTKSISADEVSKCLKSIL